MSPGALFTRTLRPCAWSGDGLWRPVAWTAGAERQPVEPEDEDELLGAAVSPDAYSIVGCRAGEVVRGVLCADGPAAPYAVVVEVGT